MRRDDRGATAVEFALVFSLVIFPLLLGVLQYGYRYWSLETAAASAREAARRLAVGTDPSCTMAEAVNHAGTSALSPVVVTYTPASGNPGVGQIVEVTISFQSLDLGLLPVPHDGVVTQTAEARVQTARTGSATDPYLTC